MDESLSSPDPLGDEPPSSAFPFTRRADNNTLTHHDLSAISIPKSQIRRSSPVRNSPRRRIFELDVGNELSPKKILVTVEAEEAMRRGINRRLFQSPHPPSSPIRGPRRKETVMTTTTIPLNDEIENEATPRRRGRPRGTGTGNGNGTPMPRGKKRAATPMKETRRTRQKNDPESEASLVDATPKGPQVDSVASKAKAKVRKTPKSKLTTEVIPSSQVSNNTIKRRRGRPRKALMPEEDAVLADTGNISGKGVASTNAARSAFDDLENLPPPSLSSVPDLPGEEEGRQVTTSDNLIDDILEASGRTPTPKNISNIYETKRTGRNPESETMSYQGEPHDSDDGMDDGYPALMETHSDVESDLDNTEQIPHSGQDTLAHASDFSMIAVESLPSFQANRSAFLSDPPEMGEETNMIINQTLESWRNSTRTEADHSLAQSTRSHVPAEEDHSGVPDRSGMEASDRSPKDRKRSPRRQKQLPLSRQIFAGKAPHVDDSFSSLPDSILKAATPGRLPMKLTSIAEQHGDTTYDDEFSEIPDAILEAATPKPASRVRSLAEGSHAEASTVDDQVNSVNRQTGSNFGSNRLPTPDDTSSSNAGSRRAQEDEPGPSTREQDVAGPSSNSGFQSSPPIINRPRAMDFGPSRLDQEINNNTPEIQHSSPQLPPSAKALTEPPKALEPPPHSRPSLSPIVRVGRTLQDVMSDRPSPERRESSLGSPFRGSTSNDPSQPFPLDQSGQSSLSKPPSRHGRSASAQFNPQSLSGPSAALSQIRRSSLSHGQSSAQGEVVGNVSAPFGPAMGNRSQSGISRNTRFDTNGRAPELSRSFDQSVSNSARTIPSSDNGINWAADGDNHQQDVKQSSGSQPTRSRSPNMFTTHGSNASRTATEAPNHEVTEQQEKGFEEQGDSALVDYEADDGDLWDFEASRVSPRRTERTRRTKVPSPWRKTSRRLIYREEIASPSQIEIEENPQSETEDAPQVRQRPRASDAHSILQGWNSEATRIIESSSPEIEQSVLDPRQDVQGVQEELEAQGEPEEEEEEEQEAREYSEARELSAELEEPEEPAVQERPREEPREPVESAKSVEAAAGPAEVSEYSMVAKQTGATPGTQQKSKSRLFGGFDILSFFSSPAILPKKTPEAGAANTNNVVEKVPQPIFQKLTHKETTSQPPKEPQKSLWSTGLFSSIPQKESQPSPERRTDLSSPAPPSQSKDTMQNSHVEASPSPEPSPSSELQSPEPESPEPPSPQSPEQVPQQSPEQSLERSPEQFSEQSHESSPERSPERSPEQLSEQSPEPSPHPSTPKRQVYPSIQQKQNFTPRPGQSGLSLFRSGPAPSRNESRNEEEDDEDLLLLPSDEEDEHDDRIEQDKQYEEDGQYEKDDEDDEDEQQEQQESSVLTDGTDYERFPPREVPSRWDRTLSPSKSCFRSPMKPTTPGRVVAFVPSALSSTVQAEINTANQQNGIRNNTVPQAPVLRSIPENAHDEATDSSTSSFSSRSTDATSPTTTTNPSTQAPPPQKGDGKPATQPSSRRPVAFTLSKTEWTRHHWVRLDELLRLRWYDPLAFQQQQEQQQQKQQSRFQRWWRRQPPAPDASDLVGRAIAAQGETLVLERWHVDVVEAFAREVGGWSEASLAKRVFALVVGERRRAARGRERVDKGKARAVA
ncbi:uncharacterized protein F4812DRAFT_467448 [Daldinia caldariorum]|uniref:uncharacterized protein n=1 Tax=Daldinia caldariorum TaxID=326644 RepID=UPI00200733F9|nr:uncharacterized protein F4812DRAFT_467448 [Daldinia caldariorum]KAI1471332.1 hypothetical protein F4812DRAFT_467448 [Daldinia caldariorum]